MTQTFARIGYGILAILIVAGFYGGYRYFNPYYEVRVYFKGIPAGTSFLCLISDDSGMHKAMPWSHHKLGAFSMHPDSDVTSSPDRSPDYSANVIWQAAQRIGVLHKNANNAWAISWLKAGMPVLQERTLLLGGGKIVIDLKDVQATESISDQQLRALGMDYSLKQ